MSANIDEVLRAICAKHELTSIGINIRPAMKGEPVTVYAHWDGGDRCSSGRGKNVAAAMSAAIIQANEIRAAAPVIPDIKMEIL